jgi:hypothetical protein
MPIFIYHEKKIYLNRNQCLSLELLLNMEKNKYIKLGDKLYDSFMERKEYHILDIDEFNWLKNNINISQL